MGVAVYTSLYPKITFNDLIQFEDGYQQLLGIGAPPTLPNAGYMIQYHNTNAREMMVLDRLKVSLDIDDVSKNYLVFSRFNDAGLAYAEPIPIPDLVVGNPNYTNLCFIIPPTWSGQVAYIPTTTDPNTNQWFQWRVRRLPWKRTHI